MSDPKTKLLVIDDETGIRTLLRHSLAGAEYELLEAATGEEGLRMAATHNPDVIILDLGLPDIDGADLVRELRTWTQTPVIVLSVRDAEGDKVAALDAGADDYLTKPFSVGELKARIRVALRHSLAGGGAAVFESGDIWVDLVGHTVRKAEAEVHLTPNEFKLLAVLIRHAGKVVTHRQLLTDVWGAQYVEESHYLRVYMGQLRQKLEDDATRPRLLLTESGVGYRLRSE